LRMGEKYTERAGRLHLLGGDLKGVEEEAGAAEVDLVVGEALDDFVEGLLELMAVVRRGDLEPAAAVAGCALAGGVAGGVVEVAVGFVAEGGGAAAVVGLSRRGREDVAAGADVVCGCGGVHGVAPSPGVL
jgi:hypothetical protein